MINRQPDNLDCTKDINNLVSEYLYQINNETLSPFLENWPSKSFKYRALESTTFPALSFLPEINVNEANKANKVIQKLKDYAGNMHWRQSYNKEAFGASFLDNYAHTELIGTRGPIVSNKVASGFLLLAPNTDYPAHRHEAEEIYIPFSEALWRQGKGSWEKKECGTIIHHKSWTPHSMRTTSGPLLALYLWHGGDLGQVPDIG
jgi:hypothetical protein